MATKINPISGFPEWLPPQRIIEQQIIARLQRTFELYGFSPLETRAVEPMDQLLRKGETSKEVYVLRRLQADESDSSDADLGLLQEFIAQPTVKPLQANSAASLVNRIKWAASVPMKSMSSPVGSGDAIAQIAQGVVQQNAAGGDMVW